MRDKGGVLVRGAVGTAVALLAIWACGGTTDSAGPIADNAAGEGTIQAGGSAQQGSGGGSAGAARAAGGRSDSAGSPGLGGSASPNDGGPASGGLIIIIDAGPDAARAECEYYGVVYQDGDTFQCHDRCNSCGCEAGVVTSTLMACPRCYDGDDVYLPDEVVQTADGCRICFCESELDFDCTLESCALVDGGMPIDASADALPPTDGGVSVDASADALPPADASADAGAETDAGTDASLPADAGVDVTTDASMATDATADADPDSSIELDPHLLTDTWYFVLPTNAIRWFQVVLCSDGRAVQWTSFNGGGEPDQETPIDGTYVVESELVVLLEFPPSAGDPYQPYESLRLEYDPDSRNVTAFDTVPEHFWGGATGVLLGPVSSMSYRLTCDGGFVAGAQ